MEFEGLLKDYRFLPAGQILSGAGTARTVTLFNCFVMGRIHPLLVIEILPVIAPGLKRREFSETPQDRIETATARLVREGRKRQ